MANECTVIILPVEDLDRAVTDAKLTNLLEAGWTPMTSVIVADDPPEIRMVLRPPPPPLPETPVMKQAVAAGAIAGIVAGVVIWILSNLIVALGA